MSDIQQRIKRVALPLTLSILAIVGSQLLLRNLYLILSFDEAVSKIFSQITYACIVPPIVPILLISSLVALPLRLLWNNPRKILQIITIPLAVVLALGIILASTLFSTINDILFWDIIQTLLPLLESGVL